MSDEEEEVTPAELLSELLMQSQTIDDLMIIFSTNDEKFKVWCNHDKTSRKLGLLDFAREVVLNPEGEEDE